jgi:hypothetical protein
MCPPAYRAGVVSFFLMISVVLINPGVHLWDNRPLWSDEILHLLTKSGKISVHEQRFMKSMLMTVLLSGSHYLP